MTSPWCVRHRTGWCAAKDQRRKPDEAASSVATRCDYFVILPGGVERREPDCTECLAKAQQAKRVKAKKAGMRRPATT